MKRATGWSAGSSLPAGWNPPHLSAIGCVAATLAIAGAVLSPGVAHAEGPAESTPEAAQAADPRQLCYGAVSSADERASGCSAVIESGKV